MPAPPSVGDRRPTSPILTVTLRRHRHRLNSTQLPMLRYPWRTAAATATLAGASAFLYHRYYSRSRQETFEYRVRTGRVYENGRPEYAMKRERLMPIEQVNARLTNMASLSAVPRPDGLTWKHATAQLPSMTAKNR